MLWSTVALSPLADQSHCFITLTCSKDLRLHAIVSLPHGTATSAALEQAHVGEKRSLGHARLHDRLGDAGCWGPHSVGLNLLLFCNTLSSAECRQWQSLVSCFLVDTSFVFTVNLYSPCVQSASVNCTTLQGCDRKFVWLCMESMGIQHCYKKAEWSMLLVSLYEVNN
jgi:hypothetical protein